jgi:hypothetical protein
MRRSISLFALLSCVAALCGCASKSSIPDLPDKLAEQGLLVARLYMPGSASWDNAKVEIDGKLHPSGLRDGFIAIALSPGEHYLPQLRIEGRLLSYEDSGSSGLRKVRGGGGAPIYYYVPGGSGVRTYFTTLAVMRRFQIEAGKITNLGLMVYLADDPKESSGGSSRQYHAVALDNSAEIGYYLETNYPALMGTLADHTPKLAPGNYLDPKKLPELRRYIAALEAKGKKIISSGTTAVLYGDAGTLVAAKPKPGGGSVFEVLDTGTLANIVDARRADDRLVFLTSEAKLLTYEGGKLSMTGIPYRIHPVKMSSIGKDNLTIVDNRMSIMTSQDGGAHWSKYDGARIDTPRSDIGVVSDAHGAYIYLGTRGIPNPILYQQAGETTPQMIAPPQQPAPPARPIEDTTLNIVIVRESGLFVVYPRNEFHFRSNATRTWQIYSKPAEGCKGIGFDTAGVDLTVECGGVKYESADSGRTWTKAGGA